MFCTNCGTKLADDAQYCYKCGTILVNQQNGNQDYQATSVIMNGENPMAGGAPAYNQQPAYQQPQYQQPAYQEPQYQAEPVDVESAASSSFIFALLGLIFSNTFYLSILGLIFSKIGLNKAEALSKQVSSLPGKAVTAKILGKIGFILGLIMTIIFGIYITILLFI